MGGDCGKQSRKEVEVVSPPILVVHGLSKITSPWKSPPFKISGVCCLVPSTPNYSFRLLLSNSLKLEIMSTDDT